MLGRTSKERVRFKHDSLPYCPAAVLSESDVSWSDVWVEPRNAQFGDVSSAGGGSSEANPQRTWNSKQ